MLLLHVVCNHTRFVKSRCTLPLGHSLLSSLMTPAKARGGVGTGGAAAHIRTHAVARAVFAIRLISSRKGKGGVDTKAAAVTSRTQVAVRAVFVIRPIDARKVQGELIPGVRLSPVVHT